MSAPATPRKSAALREQKAAEREEPTSTKRKANDAESEGRRKRLATLKARFALRGFVLQDNPDGGLTCSRWGRSRDLTEAEAETLLHEIGGA